MLKAIFIITFSVFVFGAAPEASAAIRHPSGTLIKTAASSDIYMVDRDMKSPVLRSIYDTWIGQMYFVFDDYAIVVSQEEMDSYRTIGGVNRYYIGKLLRGPDGKIYIIDTHYRKRHISSYEIFVSLGYNGTSYDPTPKTIYDTSQTHLDQFPNGDPITRTDIHPDGSVITTKTTGTVWLIEDGKKRQIRTDYIYETMGFPWRKMLHRVLSEEIGRYPDGKQINTYPSGTLFKASDGKVYVIGEGRTLRHIPSEEVFNTLGYQWKYAYGVYPELEEFYAKDEPWQLDSVSKPYLNKHPNGTLVRTSDNPAIYLIENGKKRWVSDPNVLESHNYRWDRIVTIIPEELLDYIEGEYFNKMRDGSLVMGSDGLVYVISNEKKRWIATEQIFNALGYQWSLVKRIADANLDSYETGDPVTDTNIHPNGTLAVYNNGVWLIEDGNKRPFFNVLAFEGNGYDWGRLINISDAEASLYPTGDPIIKIRDGELVRGPDGRVHVISNRKLRHVTTAGAYSSMGYGTDWYRIVPQSHLDWYSSGNPILSSSSDEASNLDLAVYSDITEYYPSVLDGYVEDRSYYNQILSENINDDYVTEEIVNDILNNGKCFKEYDYKKDNCDNKFDFSDDTMVWGNIQINGITEVHNDVVDLNPIPEADEMMEDLNSYNLMYNNSSTIKVENLQIDYLLDFQARNSLTIEKLVVNLPITKLNEVSTITTIEDFILDAKQNNIPLYGFQFDDYMSQIDRYVPFEGFTEAVEAIKAVDPSIKIIGVFYNEDLVNYATKESNPNLQAEFDTLKAIYDKLLPYFDEVAIWFWDLHTEDDFIDIYDTVKRVLPGKTVNLGIYLRDYINGTPLDLDVLDTYFTSMASLKLADKINDLYIISSYWYSHPNYTEQTQFLRDFYNTL